MTIGEEFRSRNFSIYGQWTGVLCIILCFALGLANIITLYILVIPFSIVCFICSFILIFVEIPLLLRICPMSEGFTKFIRRFETNYMRAAIYLAMSIVQFCSLIVANPTSLIAAAVFLLIASIFYTLAGVKGQGFVGSKTLGGHGVAQMIV